LTLLAALAAAVSAFLFTQVVTGHAPSFNPRRRARRAGVNRQVWLEQAGARVTPTQFWAVSAILGATTFALLLALAGAVIVALLPALAMAAGPYLYWSAERTRRLNARLARWPEAIRHVLGSVESGRLSLHRALEELARTGPDVLRPPIARYIRLSSRLGEQRALETVRHEMGDAISDRVLLTFEVAFDKGTELVTQILRDLAAQATGDRELAEKIRTAQLNIRISAWATLVLPYLMLILLCLGNSAIRSFYSSPAGLAVVVIGAVLSLVGMAIIKRLARPIVEERVFAGAASSLAAPGSLGWTAGRRGNRNVGISDSGDGRR
jgi:Flp pilus assembly protein TadB